MIKVVIIGSGNVAQHLILAFSNNEKAEVIQAFSRDAKSLSHLLNAEKITSSFSDLIEAELYIIAVSDNAIADVSSQIPFTNKLVAHTSGSISINDLDSKNRKSVFYPLQTLSKKKEVDFSAVPLCIEAQNETDLHLLNQVANHLSNHVYNVNSDQRKSIHVSAVFVSNFVNHLYQIGNEICIEHKVPFEILKPLILETAKKVQLLSPDEAQTGPAKRNDTQTINAHLNFLTNENQKEIYKILTKSIIDHGKKL